MNDTQGLDNAYKHANVRRLHEKWVAFAERYLNNEILQPEDLQDINVYFNFYETEPDPRQLEDAYRRKMKGEKDTIFMTDVPFVEAALANLETLVNKDISRFGKTVKLTNTENGIVLQIS